MKVKKWQRIVLIILAVCIILLAILPIITKSYIQNNSKELIGRQIAIDKLNINFFTGTANIINFTMLESDDTTPFISIDTLKINTVLYKLFVSNIVLEEVYVSGVNANITLKDKIFNFQDLVDFYSKKEKGTVIDTTVTKSKFSYYIKSLKLNRSKLLYTEVIDKNEFKYQLSEIVIDTDSISSEGNWISFYSNMLLNNRGKLKAKLGFNPKKPADMSLDYTVEDFQLTDLKIYSKHYVGFPLLNGVMRYKGSTKIVDNQVVSNNNLLINNIELGEKTKGIYNLPLRFALFVLKDKNNNIKLDIPARGDLNNPNLSIKKLVWTTFKNLIIKIASTPTRFLASIIGASPSDISDLVFDYGNTTLTEKHQKSIDLLLELEKSKPGLTIKLSYFNDISKESNSLNLGRIRYNSALNYIKSKNNKSKIVVVPFYSKSEKNKDSMPIFQVNFSD